MMSLLILLRLAKYYLLARSPAIDGALQSGGSLLFGVEPFDPLTLAAVCAVLAGAALVACYLPAKRASRLDPALVLRTE